MQNLKFKSWKLTNIWLLYLQKLQEIHGIRTFIPGKTIRDEQTGELVFVPGKMIFDGKNGPRFLPGQVIESEDGDERFIPGQIMDSLEDGIKRFVPGRNSLSFLKGVCL